MAAEKKPRLREKYLSIRSGQGEAAGQSSSTPAPMQVPRPVKVVINMGSGQGAQQSQDPGERRGRAGDHHRSEGGHDQGAQVDLELQAARGHGTSAPASRSGHEPHVGVPGPLHQRGAAAHPRLPRRADASERMPGDYTLGLKDQLIFPEIDYDKVDEPRGMNVTIVTTAKTTKKGANCCACSGMPFRR